MRFEWTCCCFRFEFELFPSQLEVRRFRVTSAAQMLAAKREMLRQLSHKLKTKPSALSNEPAG
ncbi:MAG: hypothetical protein HY735_34165 [Verrucomicrobia bacterium]|nr:hypothetical protein [Verrucomicrobiota bacterium]